MRVCGRTKSGVGKWRKWALVVAVVNGFPIPTKHEWNTCEILQKDK